MKFKLLSVFISVGAFFCAVTYNKMYSAQRSSIETNTAYAGANYSIKVAPQVEIVEVFAQQYAPKITGFGEVKAKFELEVKNEVSGKITYLSDKFVTGAQIKQGSIIAKIDDTSYVANLAQAKAQIAKALLNLQEEKRQGEVAYSDWLRSKEGGQKATPLILRKPQLKAAQAEFDYAQLAVKKAQKELEKTKIKAPFNSVVVSSLIQPGSYIQIGSTIGKLYSTSKAEINVPLPELQWQQLPKPLSDKTNIKWPVAIYSTTDPLSNWQGNIERIERHLNDNTRQRSVIVSVENPLQQNVPLYSGSFVKVIMQGESYDGLYKLPASAVSQSGNIWLVDDNGKLKKYSANNEFAKGDYIYIKSIKESPVKIVKRPLSHFTEGMQVLPITGTLL